MVFPGAAAICQRLARNDPSLTVLNLNHCDIGLDACHALGTSLSSNTHLVVLFLDNNAITGAGMQVLAPSLARHPRLAHLYLSYNQIGYHDNDSHDDAGCRTLVTILQQCPSLRVVKLIANGIDTHGGTLLADAVAQSDTLESVSLRSNHLGDRGVLAFGKALLHNTALQSLDLCDNQVRDERQVTEAWLAVLRGTNTTLRTLHLLHDAEDGVSFMDELAFWLQWNRVGRKSLAHHSSIQHPVPVAHLMSRAATSLSVLMATLQARPDLVTHYA